MKFYADENETVWGEWMPTENYQSWVGVVHGGIQATILDEAAEWWLNYFRGTAGVTTKMEMKFQKTVYMKDGPLRVKATHVKDLRQFVVLHVEILNCRDEVCTVAEVVYCQFPKEYSATELGFTGCELEEDPIGNK